MKKFIYYHNLFFFLATSLSDTGMCSIFRILVCFNLLMYLKNHTQYVCPNVCHVQLSDTYFIEKKRCMGNIACHVYAVLDIRQKKELIRVLNGI